MKKKTIKYIVAVPFFSNDYKFSITRKIGWSVIDYIFLKEINERELTVRELSKFSNLEPQIIIQILLPMCNVGWIDIVTSKENFIFRITITGKEAHSRSLKEHELPYDVKSYDIRREVYVDFFNNYYSINDFNSPLLTNERYINENQKNTITTLPIDKNNIYPNYEKMHNVIANDNEKVERVHDQVVYTLDSLKYLFLDMQYTEGHTEGQIIDDEKVKKINSKLIKQIKSTLPKELIKTKSIEHSSIVRDKKNYEIKVTTSRDNVDFVYGGNDTKEKFIELIKSSSDFLVIHSTFIGIWCILKDFQYTEYFLEIKEALKRGVQVYILWGKTNPDENDPNFEKSDSEDKLVEKYLRQFNEICHKEDMFNVINYNEFRRTESHAKFIITNHEKRGVCVMVSSCNFLYSNFNRFEASIVIYDNRFSRNFLDIAATICCGKSSFNSKVRKELRGFSNSISDITKDLVIPNSEKLELRLVLKNQHHSYIDLAKQARDKIYILSDLINTTPIRPIFDALRVSNAYKYYYYTEKSSNIDAIEFEKMYKDLKSVDASFQLGAHDSNSHAKVLAWDNNHLLITSLNWLSASAQDNFLEVYHEIGVYIEGWDISKDFIKVFKDL